MYLFVNRQAKRYAIGRSVDVAQAVKEHCENLPLWVAGNLKGDWPTDLTIEYGWLGQFLTMTEKTAFSYKKSNNTVKISE